MNLTDDDILRFQRGTPIFLDDICAIFPALVGEIIDEGYSIFQKYLSIMTAEKPILNGNEDSEFKALLEQLTDFQYILMMVMTDKEANQLFRDAFRFFTHENNLMFSSNPAQIIIGPPEEKHIMDERKFYDFQKILRKMYFLDTDEDDVVIYEDDEPAVKKLKLLRRKRKIDLQKAKAKKARQEGTGDLKFSDLVGSIPLDNCGLNMENIWNITYYSLQDQLKRMGWRDQFQMNHSAALAGAKLNKSQLKHWIRSIASSDKS